MSLSRVEHRDLVSELKVGAKPLRWPLVGSRELSVTHPGSEGPPSLASCLGPEQALAYNNASLTILFSKQTKPVCC